MAPSLYSLATAALAFSGSATAVQFYLEDTYDSTNFFNKFDFSTAPDKNQGYVNYLSQKQAQDAGVATIKDGQIRLGVEYNTKLVPGQGPGRGSFRLESKARFESGLFIGRFTHLPKSVCGTWPAFWTVGKTWPYDGEIDLYENWNEATENHPAFHMKDSAVYGSCKLTGVGQSSAVLTNNCDNGFQNPPIQWPNQGCVVNDNTGPYASPNGGTYAIEWTQDFIKLYTFSPGNTPANVNSDSPNTNTWGAPKAFISQSSCDLKKIFHNQQLILNIAMCGEPVGQDGTWNSCGLKTGQTCVDYVAKNPGDFKDVYFGVKDIRVFGTTKPPAKTTTTSTVAKTSTTTTSSSIKTSTTSSSVKTSTTSSSTKVSTTSSTTTKASSTSTASSTTSSAPKSTSSSTTSSSVASSTTVPAQQTSTTSKAGTGESSTTSVVVSQTSTTSKAGTGETSTTSAIVASETSTTSKAGTGETSTTTSAVVSETSTTSEAGTGETSTTTSEAGAGETSTTSEAGAGETSTTSAVGQETSTEGTITSPATPTASASSTQWSNGTTSSVEMTTSTVYTTKTHTITSCAPTVTNCPVGKVTTVVVPLYTTVCPVSEVQTVPSQPKPTKTPGSGKTTITTQVTKTYTITSCPPVVTDCPVGKVTTEVVTTTYCPGEETDVPTGGVPTGGVPTGPSGGSNTQPGGSQPSQPAVSQTEVVVPKPTGWNNGSTSAPSEGQAKPTGGVVCVGPTCPGNNGGDNKTPSGCTGPECPPPVKISGAGKVGISSAVVLGLVAAMML